jgi:four helix bundle protein
MLAYEKMDVYRCAVEFLALSAKTLNTIPKGNAGLADQLKRAALSIPLNIAESSGKTSSADRKRFCAIARGSAMECSAILDACRVLSLIDDNLVNEGKQLLVRIVSMLTKMCR